MPGQRHIYRKMWRRHRPNIGKQEVHTAQQSSWTFLHPFSWKSFTNACVHFCVTSWLWFIHFLSRMDLSPEVKEGGVGFQIDYSLGSFAFNNIRCQDQITVHLFTSQCGNSTFRIPNHGTQLQLFPQRSIFSYNHNKFHCWICNFAIWKGNITQDLRGFAF